MSNDEKILATLKDMQNQDFCMRPECSSTRVIERAIADIKDLINEARINELEQFRCYRTDDGSNERQKAERLAELKGGVMGKPIDYIYEWIKNLK